jgi:lipase chaperone LimK
MFEKSEQDKLVELKEQATTGKKISDRPVSKSEEVVKESVESQIEQTEPGLQDSNLFNNYMGELNRW